MKLRLRARVIVLSAALALALIALGALFPLRMMVRYQREHAPPSPKSFVPERFKDVRDSPGHLDHFGRDGVTCGECHQLGPGGYQAPTSTLCGKCHAEVRTAVHEESPLGAAATDCLSCHQFGDDSLIGPRKCARCHVGAPRYLEEIEVHATSDCTQCHRVHEAPSLVPRNCVDCHPNESTRHGQRAIAGAGACTDCHRVHDKEAAADARCVDCHSRGEPKVPASAVGRRHLKCVICHAPHDFSAAGVRACASCHERHAAEPVATSTKHTPCERCHTPHDVGRSGRQSCTRCHAKIRTTHPRGKATNACLGCHPAHTEHPERLTGAAARCSTCHGDPETATETMFHDRATGKTPCRACHGDHDVAPRANGAKLCARCHTRVTKTASATRGHRDCARCHEGAAHAPGRPIPSCGRCHGEQAKTAPKGHEECSRCHGGPHEVTRSRAGARCRDCHRDQARTRHARVDGSCAACHRAHGPEGPASPPPCASCHAPDERRLVHRIDAHKGQCSRCHSAHEARPKHDRAGCTGSCHRDLRDHEPGARTCVGCHPFRQRGR